MKKIMFFCLFLICKSYAQQPPYMQQLLNAQYINQNGNPVAVDADGQAINFQGVSVLPIVSAAKFVVMNNESTNYNVFNPQYVGSINVGEINLFVGALGSTLTPGSGEVELDDYAGFLLSLASDDLLERAQDGRIGSCSLGVVTTNENAACGMYVSERLSDGSKVGIPTGTGCTSYSQNTAASPAKPVINHCWSGYTSEMCQVNNPEENAANQIRWAIANGRCSLETVVAQINAPGSMLSLTSLSNIGEDLDVAQIQGENFCFYRAPLSAVNFLRGSASVYHQVNGQLYLYLSNKRACNDIVRSNIKRRGAEAFSISSSLSSDMQLSFNKYNIISNASDNELFILGSSDESLANISLSQEQPSEINSIEAQYVQNLPMGAILESIISPVSGTMQAYEAPFQAEM